MTVALDRLPYDILFHIASYLELDDVVHVGYSCRQLRLILEENTLCRKLVEACAPYCKEASEAFIGKFTYEDALKIIYDRRHAFSNAAPFSARTAGRGTEFLCRQGRLCILSGSTVAVSTVDASLDRFEIDLGVFVAAAALKLDANANFSLLYLNDDILAVHYKQNQRSDHGYILAINVDYAEAHGKRLVKQILLNASSKLFVRHTASVLYYGTYTAIGDHSRHEWELRGVSLKPGYRVASSPVQLVDFFGTDIGSTVAFEIYNNHFYAISNQTSFEVEELDWTSFYHCVRFNLDRKASDKLDINLRLYRRQHAEGPIHDSWTDLTLQLDESANEPIVVEARQEWHNGSSRQLRTFYISRLEFPASTSATDSTSPDGFEDSQLLPEDDLFTTVLDSSNKPNYAPVQPRTAFNYHPELGVHGEVRNTRTFILARTKFRAYNFSSSSFIDLVEDDRCCAKSSAEPCLRIRVGSRGVAPLDWMSPDKAGLSTAPPSHPPKLDQETRYRHSDIKLWPPATHCPCSDRLHTIMNPKTGPSYGTRSITGVVDERSLVYMVKAGRSYSADDSALGTVVVINFTRQQRRDKSSAEMTLAASSCTEQAIKGCLQPTEWHWTPGHRSLCQTGKC